MMAGVLDELYSNGTIAYGAVPGSQLQALSRTDGACRFCVNDHWTFPGECRYGKTGEPTPAPGYLEQVAAAIVAAGPPASRHDAAATSSPASAAGPSPSSRGSAS